MCGCVCARARAPRARAAPPSCCAVQKCTVRGCRGDVAPASSSRPSSRTKKVSRSPAPRELGGGNVGSPCKQAEPAGWTLTKLRPALRAHRSQNRGEQPKRGGRTHCIALRQ